jgi:hypothetical protein
MGRCMAGAYCSSCCVFVMQIQKLSVSVPMTFHSYVYMLSSIITAVTLGLIIYGIPMWTTSS